MYFIWDEKKNRQNKAKHGIGFDMAQKVFDDPLHLSIQDRHVEGEERWQTIGMVGGVVLIVAHTFSAASGAETIRIISARKATKTERLRYEQEN